MKVSLNLASCAPQPGARAIQGETMSHPHLPSRARGLGAVLATVAWAPDARAALFGSTCSEPSGTARISEPDDGHERCASYGLSAPTRLPPVLANPSCRF